MTRTVSLAGDGEAVVREAFERCVGEGGVAIFPAEGVYGLACDPLDRDAVERIQALKGRDARKPSAVMYFSPLAMRELAGSLGPRTQAAVGALLPGPVTLVVANPERRYPLACREDPERLGVRLVEGPLAGVGTPVFQTSANHSGDPAPSRFEDLDERILAGVDLAIDGGELGGEPSSVVDLSRLDSDGNWAVLREGVVSRVELERRIAAVLDT